MDKREMVRGALGHRETGRVPYCINLTGEAIQAYGERLLLRYPSEAALEAEKEGLVCRGGRVGLAMGNCMFCTGAPWWDWKDVPASYAGIDAPLEFPRTVGNGDYAHFFKKIKTIKERFGLYVLVMVYGSHFEKANFCRGIENFLGDLAGEPEFAKDLLGMIIRKNMVMLENFISASEIDGVLLGSDWGTQQSLIMSPKTWRELIAPGELQEYRLLKKNGKDVWIHSCGNIQMVLSDLVEMGVDALNPVQPECMDLVQIKEKFGGRLTFWGGISTQQTLPRGTPDQVRKETARIVGLMSRGGGYITAPSQDIQTDVPYENLVALIEGAKAAAGEA